VVLKAEEPVGGTYMPQWWLNKDDNRWEQIHVALKRHQTV